MEEALCDKNGARRTLSMSEDSVLNNMISQAEENHPGRTPAGLARPQCTSAAPCDRGEVGSATAQTLGFTTEAFEN